MSRQKNLTTRVQPSCILPCSFCRLKNLKNFLLHTKYCLTRAPYLMYTKPFFSGCKAHPHITDDKCCFHSMIFYNLLSLVSSITYAVLNYFLMHPASKACWDPEQCLCWKTQLNGERNFLIYLWRILQKSTFHLSMHSYVAFVEECYHAQFLSF